MALGRLVFDLAANVANLQKDLSGATSQITRFAQGAQSALAGIGGGLSALGIVAFVKSAVDAADNLQKLSQRVGVSVESLSALDHAASLADVSSELLSTSLAKLAKNAAEAKEGTGEAVDAFRALKVEVADSGGHLKSTEELLLDVAEKFARMEDGAGKTALAMKVFGRSGAQLIPFLNAGRDGIEDLRKEAERLGLIISGETALAAEVLNDNLTRLASSSRALGNAILNETIDPLSKMVDALLKLNEQGKLFETIGKGMAVVLETLGILAANFLFTWSTIGREIGGIAAQVAAFARGDFAGVAAIREQLIEDGKKARAELDRFEIELLSKEPKDNFERTGDLSRLKRGKAPPLANANTAKALESARQKLLDDAAKREVQRASDTARRLTEILEARYAFGLVAETEYQDRRVAIARDAFEAERKALDEQIARQQAIVNKQTRGTKEYYDALGQLQDAQEKRNKAELDFAHFSTMANLQAQKSAEDYKRTVDDLTTQVLELTGKTAEAERRRFASDTAQLRRQLGANEETGAIAQLDTIGRLREAQAAFNDQREAQSVITARLALEEERIQNAVRVGAVSQLDALKKTGEARAEAVRQMEAMVTNLERIAAASGNDKLVLQAEQARAALEQLRSETDLLAEKFDTIFKDAFSDAFTDFITNTKSAKDAFKAFTDSIVREVNRVVSQSIATDITNALGLGGGRGQGGGVGGLLAAVFGGAGGARFGGIGDAALLANEAGLVGSFASGTPFVPRTGLAMVHRGERIVPANENRMGPAVVMNVYTQDANSFRRSQGQIMADLESSASRARRRNG